MHLLAHGRKCSEVRVYALGLAHIQFGMLTMTIKQALVTSLPLEDGRNQISNSFKEILLSVELVSIETIALDFMTINHIIRNLL